MYADEQKRQFVMMRAEGKSFASICDALHISKSTCSAWQRDLQDQISAAKQDRMNELFDAYQMGREARVKRLGDTLARIEDAIAAADLSEVPLTRLLDLKLKYLAALKEEYTGTEPPQTISGEVTGTKIVEAVADLLNRVRTGDATEAQASKEGSVLASLLKAYEQAELKAKIDELELLLSARG